MVFRLDFEDMNFMKCFLFGLVEDFIDDINFISVRMLLWIKVFDTRISFLLCSYSLIIRKVSGCPSLFALGLPSGFW